MKYLNFKILESIQRGINLAIDDFEDVSIEYQKKSKIENNIHTLDLLQYIDLDLPSGTLWAKYNVGVDISSLKTKEDWYGNYYMWKDAMSLKKYKLPTIEHIKELVNNTHRKWEKDYNGVIGLCGIVYTGKNGNSIFLPAAGYMYKNRIRGLYNNEGIYWSSSINYNSSPDYARCLEFTSSYGCNTHMINNILNEFPIRTIKN